jgi:Ni,Fe-hydrogenase III large subunit/Ni,Fe-hydrogenase III component G
MSDIGYQNLREIGREFGVEIHRPGGSQLHFLVQSPAHLMRLCSRLRDEDCFLVSMIANDERELEDDCFKLYYIFSHPVEHVFLAVEYGLQPGRESYPSIFPIYAAVEPFEREISDLLGLQPEQQEPRVIPRSYLHSCYPDGLYPLRRDWSQAAMQRFMKDAALEMTLPPALERLRQSPPGELFLPVGPVYDGATEPGNYTFRISGEIVEGLDLLLGYAHKGIERLYQRNYDLGTGWKLAERVSGDASFAHSVAYSEAVEGMTGAVLPENAFVLRAMLLELERITNHIGNCMELVQILSLDIFSARLSVLHERMLQLCESLTGSRFLRGVNCPGGVTLPAPIETGRVREALREIGERFFVLAHTLVERADFRERTIGIGVLPRVTAMQLGVTGLTARASGVLRDFRIQHPSGAYNTTAAQMLLGEPPLETLTVTREMIGDVFSRFLQRVLEVRVSLRLVEYFLDGWSGGRQAAFRVSVFPARVPNFDWGLGYAEGWRGDIVYWVMKDKFERIYRCKVRDPSTLNWPGLRAAVASERQGVETALVDFPLIQRSFHLSCAGNDL